MYLENVISFQFNYLNSSLLLISLLLPSPIKSYSFLKNFRLGAPMLSSHDFTKNLAKCNDRLNVFFNN